jgi:hypothetical protein
VDENASGKEKPKERCVYSLGADRCVLAAGHNGSHEMIICERKPPARVEAEVTDSSAELRPNALPLHR